jgi:hypothetical protein
MFGGPVTSTLVAADLYDQRGIIKFNVDGMEGK